VERTSVTPSSRWQRVLTVAASSLADNEREAVLGDLTESATNGATALLQIVGLTSRRQFARWRAWQPWVAGLGIAVPAAFTTMGASLSLSRRAVTHNGAPLMVLVASAALLLAWSWSCGRALRAVSPRTVGVSVVLALLPCLFCTLRFRDTTLPVISLLLLMPAFLAGIRGAERTQHSRTPALLLAISITIGIALLGVLHIAWALPAWYLAARARDDGGRSRA
jgi:hypothetical protein